MQTKQKYHWKTSSLAYKNKQIRVLITKFWM